MVPGKASICNQCGAQFVLDSDAMREDKPRCLDCRGLSVEEDFPMTDVLREFVDKGGL
jgi:hypothetical protein